MKPRQQIEEELNRIVGVTATSEAAFNRIIIELLLDIRDSLAKVNTSLASK